MAKITVDNLAAEITMAVKEYTDDVSRAIEKELDTTSRKLVRTIKETTAFKDKTGKYRKGWIRKKDRDGYIIHNKNKPWLAHLLEFGHAKRGGKGRVSARPHIRPAYDKLAPEMEKRIEQIVKSGG